MLSKIRHKVTGEAVEHKDYIKIFQALSRRIKKDLTHATILGEGDKAIEDSKVALMTTAAVEAALAGQVQFLCRPGRALRR
jgi:hypothetical protein